MRPLVWLGLAIAALGNGLSYAFFRPQTSYTVLAVLQIVTAAGIGICFSACMLVVQAAMPPEDMAASTTGWMLVRGLAATTGACCHNQYDTITTDDPRRSGSLSSRLRLGRSHAFE